MNRSVHERLCDALSTEALHAFLGAEVAEIWGEAYDVRVVGGGQAEVAVSGAYGTEDLCVVVSRDGGVVFALGVEWITPDESQRHVARLIGRAARVQRTNVPYAHVTVLSDVLPDARAEPTRRDSVHDVHLRSFVRLAFDSVGAWRPAATCVLVVRPREDGGAEPVEWVPEVHGAAFVELYPRYFSVEALLNAALDHKQRHEYLSWMEHASASG